MIFVDTSAWFAFFSPTDPSHQRLRDWLTNAEDTLITTDYCVDETLTLLVMRREIRRAVEAGKAFMDRELTQVYFVSEDEFHRAWPLFQQRAEAGWSFTDCTSRIVISSLGISTAVALDVHFRQFGDVVVVP